MEDCVSSPLYTAFKYRSASQTEEFETFGMLRLMLLYLKPCLFIGVSVYSFIYLPIFLHVFVDVCHRVQHDAVPAEVAGIVGVGGWGAGFWGGVIALVVPQLVFGTTEHVLHPLGENGGKNSDIDQCVLCAS